MIRRYLLELVPVGGERWADVPPVCRLRRALKGLSRGYGLKAVSVESVIVESGKGAREQTRTEPANRNPLETQAEESDRYRSVAAASEFTEGEFTE